MGRNYKMNPYNTELRVRLVDKNGELMRMISQVDGFRLLRYRFFTLLMRQEPTIRFEMNKEEWDDRFPRAKSTWKRGYLEARHAVMYGNFRIQGPDGREMFHCSSQKALWYLNRNLVEIVSEDPPTLRLRFLPNGEGHVGDNYYLTEKHNRCVVCGTEEFLSRHHVMPRVFRRYMPEEIKEHSHHDVLLLCLDCHMRYERNGDHYKREICQKLDLSMNECWQNYDPEVDRAVRAARALLSERLWEVKVKETPQERLDKLQDQMKSLGRLDAIKLARDFFGVGLSVAKQYVENGILPESFSLDVSQTKNAETTREEWRKIVQEYLGKEKITQEDIQAVSKQKAWTPLEGHDNYGKSVLDKIGDFQEFIESWRKHFLDIMNPQFLPEHWEINRSATRNRP